MRQISPTLISFHSSLSFSFPNLPANPRLQIPVRFRFHIRSMASHVVGYPRIGPKRELKFALESFWDGKSNAEELHKVASDLRVSIWKQMADAGIKYIPSNTFSYYDQVLDTTAMLGAVPSRYGWSGGDIGFDVYFSMARGNASVPAMEMTKWFDTNYHYIVPELGLKTEFSYASRKAVQEYKEARALGIDTVPVLVGPVSYLLLSKPAKGVGKSFSLLSLLDKILPIYKEVVAELKAAGASWIQFDEPTLVMDLDSHKLHAFTHAYKELESSVSGLNVLIETYFADLPAEAYNTVTALKGVTAIGFDLVRGSNTLDLIKNGYPPEKYLFAGVVDGRNIWANDLDASLSTLLALEGVVGKDKLVVSTSCSLLHTAVDLVNETKLDEELKSWLAFAAQKLLEVNGLAKALSGQNDEAFYSANAAAHASRRSSPRVTDEDVQIATAALKGSDHRRATNVSARLESQHEKLNLPIIPTTTIGSFPQTLELRKIRREYKASKISEEDYVKAIKEEIEAVVKLQEELGIDVLVHGEPERNDMVEYFGEQLSGFAFTVNGWVQSYGSRCVKPPIIYGDVSRPKAMTVFWSKLAQSMTQRPMKGMLTGPVTILNWSFVRNDQPRNETCYQIALAIKNEVDDLEKAGIGVIQIDEAALREGLPLRKSEQQFYLDWAVHSFRITNSAVQDTTQIHTHMCYSNFNDIIDSIIDMDADVITIENSRSDEKLLSVFREGGVKYSAGMGPGVYDIHSPRIPSTEEIVDRVNKMLTVLDSKFLWVNPDCGLKTRKYSEVKPALNNMVAAAKLARNNLAANKYKLLILCRKRYNTREHKERKKKKRTMYKSKLQELCHKQKWGLPKYTCVKDGEDHCPMFKASVVVSGITFNSPPALTSSKQAYNEAAQLAFLHFTSEPSSEETEYVEKTNGEIKTENSVKSEGMTVKRCENLDPSDQKSEYTEKKNSEKEVQSSVKSEDMTEKYRDNIDFHDEFKKKLQIYAKKKNLDLIVYHIEKEGVCYKARVSIGEDWFESQQLSETAEEAENAAAQSALLSLSTDAFNENDPHSYKILLQELADKEGFFPPKYTTTVPRDSRIQTFSSTVEVEGEVFQGDTAKSKKLAELNAAKTAYTVFTERKLFNPGYFSPMSPGDDIIKLAPRLESVVISDKKENPISGSPSNFSSSKKHETEEQDNIGESEEIVYRTPDSTTTKKTNETESYLLCNRVKVFTSIPNMALPRGTVVLPISENRWTVVNLEFPRERGI